MKVSEGLLVVAHREFLDWELSTCSGKGEL